MVCWQCRWGPSPYNDARLLRVISIGTPWLRPSPDLWPSGGARVSFLLVTHASPLPLWWPPQVSGRPSRRHVSLRVFAHPRRFQREHICLPRLCVLLLPRHPQAALQSYVHREMAGVGGVSLTRPGPRRPCPAGTASCGWCTRASRSAGPGPPARNETFTCTPGLAAAWRKRQPWPG